jgi:hypothetical protein
VAEVVGHVVAAEGQHGHRVAAHFAGLTPFAAAVVSEPMVAARYTPWAQLKAWNTSGMSCSAAAEDERADRHALRDLPRRGRCDGHWRCRRGEARVRVRGRRGRSPGVQSLPCQSMRCAGGVSVMPSHHTSPSSVSATLVKMQLRVRSPSRWGWSSSLVPGATPKKPASGLIA